jgi:hypothetical protein
MTAQHAAHIRKILDTIVEIIAEEPGGTPSGILYAGLMNYGITFNTYEAMIAHLKNEGRITESFNVLHATGK